MRPLDGHGEPQLLRGGDDVARSPGDGEWGGHRELGARRSSPVKGQPARRLSGLEAPSGWAAQARSWSSISCATAEAGAPPCGWCSPLPMAVRRSTASTSEQGGISGAAEIDAPEHDPLPRGARTWPQCGRPCGGRSRTAVFVRMPRLTPGVIRPPYQRLGSSTSARAGTRALRAQNSRWLRAGGRHGRARFGVFEPHLHRHPARRCVTWSAELPDRRGRRRPRRGYCPRSR
jgi:hypothetical protein